MKLNKKITNAMIAAVVGVGLAGFSASTLAGHQPGHMNGKIKCYGVAKRTKMGQNYVWMTKKQCAAAKKRYKNKRDGSYSMQQQHQSSSSSPAEQNQSQNQNPNQGQESQS